DRAQAFQVTEATLDFAARTILPPAPAPIAASYNVQGQTNCANAPCADNPATAIPNAAGWIFPPPVKTGAGTSNTGNIVSLYGNTPSYIIQYMGNCTSSSKGNFQFTNDQNNQGGGGSMQTSNTCYRITARGGAVAGRAQIVLQAVYRAPPG
ncbi:MAG: hypothetical protein PF483_08035, partial [Halothiobacillus sp.]|nr:hypothetical protein [Halothiobacillus sp.]